MMPLVRIPLIAVRRVGCLGAVPRVSFLVVALLVLAATGCASLRYGGAAALRIESNVPDAAVYIDDTFVGRASEWAVDGRFVKPGFHRVELRHPDHFTDYIDVKLARGDAVLLKPILRPRLDSDWD